MIILQALLFLLKCILILLLSILGIVLLLLLILLLVPIRYRIEGGYYEAPDLKVKVSWLFSFISVFFGLQDKETDFKIILFGISIFDSKKKKPKKKKKPEKKKPEKKKPESSDSIQKAEVPEIKEIISEDALAEERTIPSKDFSSAEPVEKKEKSFSPSSTEEKIKKEKKKTDWENIKRNIVFIREQWEDPANQALLKDILFRLKKILLHLLPTKLRFYLHFGMEDNPAAMGQILSIVSLLYPIYGESVQFVPDFEEKVIEGKGLVQGRIRLIVLVYAVIRILLNPQVKILIRRIKRQNGARS